MALPLIAGVLLKGVAANVASNALSGSGNGGSDPVSGLLNSILGNAIPKPEDLLGGGGLNLFS